NSNAGGAGGAATTTVSAASSTSAASGQAPPPAKKPNNAATAATTAAAASTAASTTAPIIRSDPSALPTRQYLDQTVAPVLLHGLQTLARERPSDPIKFLAGYLLKHSNGSDEAQASNEAAT
ncbi:hypothetical protein KR215_003771, partial [Drosophila sulfurigaster]